MTYYTAAELRGFSGGLTASASTLVLKAAARSASGPFDIFLSHSFLDADVIIGLKRLFEAQGQTVYVDWIDDAEVDRTKVSPDTAALVQRRMASSRSLVYATSRSSKRSRWMPWELGYFDGIKGADQITICPIETGTDRAAAFVGEEYLGLYKTMEKINWNGSWRPSAVRPSRTQVQRIAKFVDGTGEYVGLGR